MFPLKNTIKLSQTVSSTQSGQSKAHLICPPPKNSYFCRCKTCYFEIKQLFQNSQERSNKSFPTDLTLEICCNQTELRH